MKNKNVGHDEINLLAERAAIFYGYLDANELHQVFPYREKAWADLEARVNSGSLPKLRVLNKVIDNTLIGKNSLAVHDRHAILLQFEERLQENRNELLNKRLALFDKIMQEGFIKSNLTINDAIEIQNSPMLDLNDEQRKRLGEIIHRSMVERPLPGSRSKGS
jgi:hypothetical protein